MSFQKKSVLIIIVMMLVGVLTACSLLFPPKIQEPSSPVITADMASMDTPHPVDGMYASCMNCHGDVEASHSSFLQDGWLTEANCVLCHAAAEGVGEAGDLVEVPHGVDGMYENCLSCHETAIKASHEPMGAMDNSTCLNCHTISADAGSVEPIVIKLPGNHDSPAFASCATCHTGDAVASGIPHELDGNYADCASCHTIEYDEVKAPSVIKLPAGHNNPAFASCATCHSGDAVANKIPHALDGNYADCKSCHTVEYEAAAPPAGGEAAAPAPAGPGPISLPADHDNPAYATCTTCHNSPFDISTKVPHLDGAYATCSGCHTVNYN